MASRCAAQDDLLVRRNHLGFNIGANFAVGSHFQRLGFVFNFFYTQGHLQANTELRAYVNVKSPGPDGCFPELVLSQGLLVGYGEASAWHNPFLGNVGNQTGYSNSVAYAYQAYFNRIGTTQQTGVIAIQVNAWSIVAENDILGHTYFDRFRTGGFLIQYQFEDKLQAAVNTLMWTGQMGRQTQSAFFRSGCYMDTTGARFALISHGLLSAQLRYNIGLGQNVQANLGIDAEQVRNAVQNKFIHDMPFLPKKWRPKNCHIPMLDQNGYQYLGEPRQRVRSPRLYWNVFSNANVFY